MIQRRRSRVVPTSTVETVTPKSAQEWLENASANRTLSQQKVDKYARDIQAGNWHLNGETIKFDTSGKMFDGQHRCWAVMEADKSIDAFVVRGLPTEVRETVDHGRARTVRDILVMRGESHSRLMAGGATWLWRWEQDQWAVRVSPSHQEAMATIENHPGFRSSVAFVSKSGPFRSSMFALVHYVGMMADSAAADEFITGVFNGVNLTAGDPRLCLRDRLLADRGNKAKLPAREVAALIIKSWNHYVTGNTVRKLRWRQEGSRVEQFPVIEGSAQLRRRISRGAKKS